MTNAFANSLFGSGGMSGNSGTLSTSSHNEDRLVTR